LTMPRPGVRVDRLREATEIVAGLLTGEPLTYTGTYHHAHHAILDPPALQVPRPPVFIGGKGDRVIRTAVAVADGWNTCWVWTPAAYRERLTVFEAAANEAGRNPDQVWRSVGLYALVGENEPDLARRFERLRSLTPAGVLDAVTLDQYRAGRLVGTVAQVREQLEEWADLGVETLIVGAGALPFQVGSLDDVDAIAEALIGPGGAGRR
jgi:alkanesulfonate monooxygenase SsuD/methylene tetrahydromethanopterin reductase-like flavin-dependent oxidoreductase (luciferase family)